VSFVETGERVRAARLRERLTQQEAAARLGVTQAYLSMLERGERAVTADVALRVVTVLGGDATFLPVSEAGFLDFKEALGALGYPGFRYLAGERVWNPAEFLLKALDEENLDARVTEALPWVVARYVGLDWRWLEAQVRLRDRQNRLAYVVSVALEGLRAQRKEKEVEVLRASLARLERGRLAVEDTLCKASLTEAERRWLRERWSEVARHWNLLTDLTVDQVDWSAV